jgi:hypothetical protein
MLATFLFVLLSPAGAQVQTVQGKATLSYQGPASTPADRILALQKAQVNAFDYYYAEAGDSESQNYASVKDQIFRDIDRYVLDTTVLSESDDVVGRKYTVVVKLALNVPNLRALMKQNSTVGSATRDQKSRLAFLFVSRSVDSVKTYDARVYKRADASAQVRATETQAGAQSDDNPGSVNSAVAAGGTGIASVEQSTATSETGGSAVRKSKETTWRIAPSADLNQIFTQVFSKAGFRVQEAALVQSAAGGKFKLEAVEEDYKSGNDLKAATLQTIVDGMRVASVPLLALGTLDLGLVDTDPQTGLYRVVVTVNARLLDLNEAIPETVASVGPTQYSGKGPTEDEARTNALKSAANSAARELASQLTSQGIH